MAKKTIKPVWYIIKESWTKQETIKYTAKPTLKLYTEWVWPNRKLVLIRQGVKDCVPFPTVDIEPSEIISNDPENIIKIGTDGLLLVDPADVPTKCDEVIECIENADSIDLSNVDITGLRDNLEFFEWAEYSGLLYTKTDGTTINVNTWYVETITPAPTIPYTINHNLNSTRVVIQAYDVVSGAEVDVIFTNRTLTSVDLVSSTSDPIEVVIKK